jgi:hypothetical protein
MVSYEIISQILKEKIVTSGNAAELKRPVNEAKRALGKKRKGRKKKARRRTYHEKKVYITMNLKHSSRTFFE